MKFQRDIFTVSFYSSGFSFEWVIIVRFRPWGVGCGGLGATWSYKFTESACDQAFSANVESEIPTVPFLHLT